MYVVQDWAEVHRLFHRGGLSKSAIARRLGMSRTTVIELLARDGPPRYERRPTGSMLDPFKDEIRRMLADDPDVAATVVLERIRRSGFAGRITIVRDSSPRSGRSSPVRRRSSGPAICRVRSARSTGGIPASGLMSAAAACVRRSGWW